MNALMIAVLVLVLLLLGALLALVLWTRAMRRDVERLERELGTKPLPEHDGQLSTDRRWYTCLHRGRATLRAL